MLKVNKNPSPSEVRRFGLVWMAVVLVLATVLYWCHRVATAYALFGIGLTVGCVSTLAPLFGRVFYRAWMGLASAINWMVSRLALSILFWGIVTPVAIVFKILRRDALRLKRGRLATSYWQDHEKIIDASYYKHLF